MKKMLDREKALENLWSNKFSNQGIVASECEQMRLLDIPIFYTDTHFNESTMILEIILFPYINFLDMTIL